MQRLNFLLIGLVFSLKTAAMPITVVELFTSQGCYSCPPADKLLGELAQEANTITIACHVGYWNYLGWRDTFSKPFCDQRQRHYQQYLKGNAGVYTPQMVINGRYGVVGSRRTKVKQFIRAAHNDSPTQLNITKINARQVQIHLPKLDKGKYRLWLMGTLAQQKIPIARGENGGKRLTYHHPLQRVTEIGKWDGEAITLEQMLPEQNESAITHWVVLAQSEPLGAIVAAGQIAGTN